VTPRQIARTSSTSTSSAQRRTSVGTTAAPTRRRLPPKRQRHHHRFPRQVAPRRPVALSTAAKHASYSRPSSRSSGSSIVCRIVAAARRAVPVPHRPRPTCRSTSGRVRPARQQVRLPSLSNAATAVLRRHRGFNWRRPVWTSRSVRCRYTEPEPVCTECEWRSIRHKQQRSSVPERRVRNCLPEVLRRRPAGL